MKNKSASLIALFFLLVATTSASAFYDPGTQRWLNRDPITDVGFRMVSNKELLEVANQESETNLYGFLHNNPLTNFDAQGLKLGTISTCIVFDPFSFGGNIAILIGYTFDTKSERTRQRCCDAVKRLLPPCADTFDKAAAQVYWQTCLLLGK